MLTFFKRCLTDWPASRLWVTGFLLVAFTWVGIVPMCLLAVDGVETTATITRIDPYKPHSNLYEFEVDGRLYTGRQGFGDAGAVKVLVGHQIPVTYFAKDPSVSLMGPKSKYGWANSIGITFVVLGFVAVISVVSLFFGRR